VKSSTRRTFADENTAEDALATAKNIYKL
jgi:hypothetical protein